MLNLQDNLRPREIERQVREYQKVHRLLPYFTSWCMDALATSKNGYIVYSTAEHPAGAHGPVSTSSADYFTNRLEAENVFNRKKSRPGVVLAHVIESDQELWKLNEEEGEKQEIGNDLGASAINCCYPALISF